MNIPQGRDKSRPYQIIFRRRILEPFTSLTGLVARLDRMNVTTDEITPARFLKTTRRSGFENLLFANWRYLDPAATPPNPDSVLNQRIYQDATILIPAHH